MIKIKMAGLTVMIDNKYQYLEALTTDFLTDDEPDFSVAVTDAEIEAARSAHAPNMSHGYAESIAVYAKIAEFLPKYDAYLIHGVAFSANGGAHVVTAAPGVGKTTHVRLWKNEFPDVDIINGDKPILRFFGGEPYICATPWRGKEGLGNKSITKLSSAIFLSRAEGNSITELSASEMADIFLKSVYIPKKIDMMAKLLELVDKTLSSIRTFALSCNMEPQAAHVARAAVIGDKNG